MNKTELLTLILSFVEGFALIISPCILPLLPLVLAGSLSGSKRKPLGIIIGFSLCFSLFAFFSRFISSYFNLDLNVIRYIAFALLLLLGLTLLSDFLTEHFNKWTSSFANLFSKKVYSQNKEAGFLSGLVTGSLIALVWTPCAGPILATILVQILIQDNNLISFFMLLAFALGAALPMLIIAFFGLKLTESFRFFKTRAYLFRKLLGCIIIAATLFMIYQENSQQRVDIEGKQGSLKITKTLENALWQPYTAPELNGIDTWFNSKPLYISELKGKVILIDFWTYSCINCIRTLPYLKNWYQHYKNEGLVIIGVHTPEFEFEKNKDNVKSAINRFGITYPVALDNQFLTWRNFNNHYWPAHYLINQEGRVVYSHFGEGDYDITENNIRFLLGLNNKTSLNQDRTNYNGMTGETYLGYDRVNPNLSPSPYLANQIRDFNYPNEHNLHTFALQGKWQILADKIMAIEPQASIKIHFKASKVYAVMASKSGKPIEVSILINGKKLKNIIIDKAALFTLLDGAESRNAILELISHQEGLEIYTFTFGGG